MTKAQKAILETLSKHGHMTADFTFNEVRKHIPSIALGTVYRNLNQFAEKKLIKRIIRGIAPDIFDASTHEHGHVICVKCGETRDITLPGFKDYISVHLDGDVLSVEVLAFDECGDCKASVFG